MRAVVFGSPGEDTTLRVAEVARPVLGPSEVRIRVVGAGINRADLYQRRGLYPPPPGASEILGLECAGEIFEVGRESTGFRTGDQVMALLAGGGYAEEVVAPCECVMPVPASLTMVEAAGVPEAFITGFLNLFLIGHLQPGETVLVHGGSGGVGTAAIQLARHAGAQIVVTAGSSDRCHRCLELGADAAVDYHAEDFAETASALTGGRGVDLILDCIGGSYLDRHLDLLDTGGRLVVIGLQGGARTEIDLAKILRKRLLIAGSTLRARPIEEKGRIIGAFLGRFGDALDTGSIQPVIDHTMPFEDADEAHQRFAAGKIFGKLILTPS